MYGTDIDDHIEGGKGEGELDWKGLEFNGNAKDE